MRDGGIVNLYTLTNTAANGAMPSLKLVAAGSAYYSYRTAGVMRRYEAKGNNADFDYVIRVWNMTALPSGCEYAIPEDGEQYRIDPAEPIYDEDAIDLTLTRLEEYYNVADADTET